MQHTVEGVSRVKCLGVVCRKTALSMLESRLLASMRSSSTWHRMPRAYSWKTPPWNEPRDFHEPCVVCNAMLCARCASKVLS